MLPALFLINAKEYTLPVFLFTMLLMFTAILLKIKTVKLYTLQTEYNELRDTSTSYQRLLEEKNRIKEGADGHGGIFRAMIESGVLDDMKKRDIKWIFTCGIDNVLTRPNDLLFLGYVIERGSMIGCKSLVKRGPYEKVGVFCKVKGRPSVIEYTEISDEMANLRDEKGNLAYGINS